jgi:hypothetical protein
LRVLIFSTISCVNARQKGHLGEKYSITIGVPIGIAAVFKRLLFLVSKKSNEGIVVPSKPVLTIEGE